MNTSLPSLCVLSLVCRLYCMEHKLLFAASTIHHLHPLWEVCQPIEQLVPVVTTTSSIFSSFLGTSKYLVFFPPFFSQLKSPG